MEIKSNRKVYSIGVFLLALFYLGFTGYLAINTTDGMPPDEHYHIVLSLKYKETWGLVEDAEDTWYLGQLSRQPFLYHWTMGRLLNLNFAGIEEKLLLRSAAVVIGAVTLMFYMLIANEVTKNIYIRLLAPFMVVSTLMYAFMTAAINYDSFALLFSAMSIYFFIRFVKYHEIDSLQATAIFLILGLLSKVSLFPLALVLILILLVHILSNWEIIKHSWVIISFKRLILLLITIFVVFLATWFYGGNLLKYGELVPQCSSVLSDTACQRSAQIQRDIRLVEVNKDVPILDPVSYIGIWTSTMFATIFGIAAHAALFRSFIGFMPVLLLFLGSFLLVIRKIKFNDRVNLYLTSIAAFYTVFLLVYVNYYSAYLSLKDVVVALQGRYIFPVYFIITLISMVFLFKEFKSKAFQAIIAGVIIMWYLYGGLGFYYRAVPSAFVKECNFIVQLKNCN